MPAWNAVDMHPGYMRQVSVLCPSICSSVCPSVRPWDRIDERM